MRKVRTLIKGQVYRLYLLLAALVIAGVGIMPFFMSGSASAITYGQIVTRSLTISSGVPSNPSVTYTFTFTPHSTTQVEYMKFIACNAPAVYTYPGDTSNCVAPNGLSFSSATFNAGAFSGWQGATNFAVDNTGANDCTPAANVLCVDRTDATSQTITPRTIAFNHIANPSTANTAFFVGIYTYSGLTGSYQAADLVDFGATAAAVTQTLTTNAAVAEVLQFCVGATTVDGVDTPITDLVANDCSGVSGTTVDIGTLDTSAINISPVATNGGNGNNAVAMVRSNAGNGVGVYYDAIQDPGGTYHKGTLKIAGDPCSNANGPGNTPGAPAASGPFTDGCIDSAGTTQNVFGAGSEEFGMTVAGVNSLGTSSYTCQYGDTAESVAAGNTCHMEPQTNYLGDGASGTETYGTANGFAWDESGASNLIASSAASTIKQVDDEALMIKFAATPSITTPFGRYSVQTDFTAVPTY